MASDDKVFEKYLKVCALAEQGDGGEASNARRIADKMAREHPWLPEAKLAHEEAAAQQSQAPAWEGPQEPPERPWADIFSAAQNMYSRVSDFAESVSQARKGALLASACKVSARISRGGNLIVGTSIPDHILEELEECNLTQLRVFRNELLERLENQMNDALGLES